MIAMLCCLLIQDLWHKSAGADLATPRVRPDARMGPIVNRSAGHIEPRKINFDLGVEGGFSCGKFDLNSSFGSILNKEMAGKLFDTAINQMRQELAASPMVLACQMSPTLCDVMKHFRVTAGDLLQIELADCHSIEDRAGTTANTLQARSQQQCLAELQASGVPLDEALKRCRASSEVRGLSGRRQPEVNLVQELSDVFSLSPESKSILSELLDTTRLSPGGWKGDVKLRAIDAAYERNRAAYTERLLTAIKGSALNGSWPVSLPPMEPADVDLLRTLDEGTQRTAVTTLSASYALVDLADLVHEVQSLLESAESMADDPTLREQYARQSNRMGRELARLREAADVSSRAMETWSSIRSAAEGIRQDKIRQGTAPFRYDVAARQEESRLKPWGKYCEEPLCPSKEQRK